ncbi:GIY-YIG nuclease family protein [Nocardioides humilatus]|uniref:GIY-YIG nuclease family protein n=1 Tax=Nocardioides humilatus TaxID=2607660 RepID=A0A5B1LQE3_9ACTN|nr:GIY-YIG nuclease family protein [Nocardioides humilatus]KAA1421827.1 GIY-YIG nuclease family protein [Nocardioides humilatus]
MPWAYLLKCADDSYYAGSTIDLERRLYEHGTDDLGPLYTRRRRPVELVWSGWFDRIDDAFWFEKRVQGWSRAKREALIRNDWEALPFLAKRPSAQRKLEEQCDGPQEACRALVSRLAALAPQPAAYPGG